MVQDGASMKKAFTDLMAILVMDEYSRTPFSLSRVSIGSTPARISIHNKVSPSSVFEDPTKSV